MFPSTTDLAGLFQLTSGPSAVTISHIFLFVVALRPSRRSVRATMPAPVQTDMRYFTFGYLSRMKSVCVVVFLSWPPMPPCISRTSMPSGALSKVRVGFT